MKRRPAIVGIIIVVVVVAGVALVITRTIGAHMLPYPALNKVLAPTSEQVVISIAKDALNKGNMAYLPNPAQVQLGTTVVWKNNDSTSHYVTSEKG